MNDIPNRAIQSFIIKNRYFFLILLICTSCSTASISSKSLYEHSANPIQVNSSFIWGINGHPLVNDEYLGSTIQTQLELLNEHQFTFYRIDVSTLQSGKIKEHRVTRFDSLLISANEKDIEILPVLKFYTEHIEENNLNKEEAFHYGYNQGRGFAEKYGKYFQYYGLENELDLRTKTSLESGFRKEDFSSEKIIVISEYFKGMTKGIKEVDKDAKTIINCGGWTNWGFFTAILDGGVQFDILAYHWYSAHNRSLFQIDQPFINVLDSLNSFEKPIWITEIGRSEGSKYNKEKEQAVMMNLFLENINKKNNIQAFFVYELFDQPYLGTQKWSNYNSKYYGIIGWKTNPPNYSEFYYKPVSKLLKFRIEESNHGYEDYIHAILSDLYEEVPSENDFRYWTTRFEILKNKDAVIKEILGNRVSSIEKIIQESGNSENYEPQITTVYQLFLKRAPIDKEIKYWNRKLKKQLKVQDLPINILLSEEYWENAIWKGYEKRTGFKRPENPTVFD